MELTPTAEQRFEQTTKAITFLAGRLRLEAFESLSGFHLALSVSGNEGDRSPVTVDVPRREAIAFRRAVRLFNGALDGEAARIAARNRRRRARRVLAATSKPTHFSR